MKKRLTIFILTCFLLIGMLPTAKAVELDRACSLTFQMEYDGKKLNSGSLTICRVADVMNLGSWHFDLIPELSDSGLSLQNLSDPALASALADLVVEKQLVTEVAYIRSGKASFSDLTVGLYVVMQKEDQASAGYDAIAPFLISLPQIENGQYTYDVRLKPKVPLKPEPTKPTRPTKPTEPHLPQTGQLNWPVPVMAAGGMLLFALGWYLCFGKREGYET